MKNNYILVVNEFNKLKNYYDKVYDQAEILLKENKQLKFAIQKKNENTENTKIEDNDINK